MSKYTEIDLNTLPNLREVLENNDLLRFKYYITIGKVTEWDVKYFKIEDKKAINDAYSNEMKDMSRYMQNATIHILTNKIELHYDFEGSRTYEVKYDSKEYDSTTKRENFNKWLERKIITIIDRMNMYKFN